MKILSTTWNMFEYSADATSIAPNGGAVMVFNICKWIGKYEESYVFCGASKNKAFDIDGVHVLANDEYLDTVSSRDEIDISLWLERIRMAFKRTLKQLSPDFVLVHGGMDFSLDVIAECEKQKIPFSYVSHLYQGKQVLYKENAKLRVYEDVLFEKDINIITVSDGMRNRILEEHPNIDKKRIQTIRNAVENQGENYVHKENEIIATLKKSGKRILLCAGTIDHRKNQIQLVKAYSLLSEKVKNNVSIIFCGKDSKNDSMLGELNGLIKSYNLENSIKYLGVVNQEEMPNIYKNVDVLISASLCEGLSLVVLEMLQFGKPVIMFSDNETAEDVKDEGAVVLIKDHSDETVAKAIEQWYERQWDSKYIIEYSKQYNMELVADQYIGYVEAHRQ